MIPALGSLSRMVSRGVQPSRADLATLLAGMDVTPDEAVMDELVRWSELLVEVRREPTPGRRATTIEVLLLRGVPPPWLRKVLLKGTERKLDFADEVENG